MTRIRISLLPAELKKQSSMMKVWTILALVLTIVAMVLMAGNILFSFWLETPVSELESLKDQNKNMTDNIGRLIYIQEMFDEIETNNSIIKALEGNNPDWAYLLGETSADLTLYGLNMTRMELVAVGEESGCQITGETENAENLDNWRTHIESLDGIDSILLGEITTEPLSEGRLVFHFDAWITIAQWNME